MRSDVIRVYKSLHTWTGLIAGMALFICFFAGALTMFEEPLAQWASPPVEQALQSRPWVGPERWSALIDATLQHDPQVAKGFLLNLQPQPGLPAPMVWREGGFRAGADKPLQWSTLEEGGELVTSSFEQDQLAQLIDTLHQTAGIPGELGHHHFGVYVMGVVGALYALAIFSGLIVLLPTLIADLFAVRPGKNRKRFWLDAHNVVGIASLPFHVVIALTVVVFAFHDFIYTGVDAAAFGDRPMFERPSHEAFAETRPLLPPAQLLDRLREAAPEFEPRQMTYQNVGMSNASVNVMGSSDFGMQRGPTYGMAGMNPYTGELTDTTYLPSLASGWGQVVTVFFALHFGNFGGDLIRWVYFALGISGAFIFYSGNLLWIESRRKRQRRNAAPVAQTRSTRLMAAATVGVCWGSVAGVAAAMAASKWLQALGLDTAFWYMTIYYTMFLGAVAWAFWRGAAKAVVKLIRMSGLLMLAIPATGLLVLLVPALPIWLHTSPELLMVDLTALLVGGALLFAAARTRRRIAGGVGDSVWHLDTVNRDGAMCVEQREGDHRREVA